MKEQPQEDMERDQADEKRRPDSDPRRQPGGGRGGRARGVSMSAVLKANGWTIWHALGALALAAAGIALTHQAWGDMLRMALNDEESSHILLVGIAVPWLVSARWEQMKRCRPRGLWIGPLFVALGWALHIYGYDYQYDLLWHAGAVMVAAGCALCFLGRDVLLRFLPAFIVLGFLLPVPGRVRADIAIPLQNAMAYLTEQIGQVLGMGVNRAGNVLIVNGQQIEIAEACNGMRMVFGLFLVAYTFTFAMPLRTSVRVLLLVAAPLFAMLCNVIRVIPTVWLYGHASQGLADQFHDISGWAMIFAGLFMLMGMLWLLQWAGVPVMRREQGVSTPPGAAGAADSGTGRTLWRPFVPGAGAVAVVLLMGLAFMVQSRQMPTQALVFHEQLHQQAQGVPLLIGEWYGRDVEVPTEAVDLLDPNILISRRYENLRTGHAVTLLLVQCRDARDLAYHYPPICYPNSGWEQLWARSHEWEVNGRPIPLMEYGFQKESFDRKDQIVIANFMLLPTGKMDRGMEPLYVLAGDPFMRFYGAGEVQLIFDAATPPDQRREIFRTFVGANLPLLENMLEGVER